MFAADACTRTGIGKQRTALASDNDGLGSCFQGDVELLLVAEAEADAFSTAGAETFGGDFNGIGATDTQAAGVITAGGVGARRVARTGGGVGDGNGGIGDRRVVGVGNDPTNGGSCLLGVDGRRGGCGQERHNGGAGHISVEHT